MDVLVSLYLLKPVSEDVAIVISSRVVRISKFLFESNIRNLLYRIFRIESNINTVTLAPVGEVGLIREWK